MLYILTSDMFFYNGLKSMYGDNNIVQLFSLDNIKRKYTPSDCLLIDMLRCQLKGPEYIYLVQELILGRIIILSSFRLSRFKSLSPVIFIPRNINPEMLSLCPEIFLDEPEIILPTLTLREYEIITQLTNHHDDTRIASSLGITIATLRIHKYQLMLKLKLKKMSHIMNTEHYAYING
ncbi:hypothetical protein MMC72_005074 [Salmonella enterica]|nr:hypothetical protein [Salmonella enterica]